MPSPAREPFVPLQSGRAPGGPCTPGAQGLAPIAQRLRELVDRHSPWNRSLWQPGTVLALREVLEYAHLVDIKAQRPEGLQYVAAVARGQVLSDPGCGPRAVRDKIAGHLASAAPRPAGKGGTLPATDREALQELCRRVEATYLEHWQEAVTRGFCTARSTTGSSDPADLCARAIAGHLLDNGLSGHHLHGWLTHKLAPGNGTTLTELLRDAADMVAKPVRLYDVVVPYPKLPMRSLPETTGPVEILNAHALEELCRQEGVPAPRRGAGALKLRVHARDPWSAMAEAEEFVRRVGARARLAGKEARAEERVLILHSGEWRKLSTWALPSRLPSIHRRELFLPNPHSGFIVDEALELLDATTTATSWAAVAGSWAAIEGVLARPEEPGVIAADRLAAILACSYPRAELVLLARTWRAKGADAIAERLRSLDSHAARIHAVMEALTNGGDLPERVVAANPVAVARLKSLIAHPSAVLTRVQDHLRSCIRRLYNQRNLVMHRGHTSSVSLDATLRSVPALAAAGLDQIVNAVLDHGVATGIALAARAENELALLGTEAAAGPPPAGLRRWVSGGG